jgi:hypothetical protein
VAAGVGRLKPPDLPCSDPVGAQVFVIDLASRDSAYRAVSFVALGLLLLGAAFAWQKLRPVLTTA